MALRAAYWTMHRQTMAALSRHGVTADQLVILSLLMEQDGLKQRELVHRASSDPNTIRAMLVLLEKNGFVERRSHPTDGRARSVLITPQGRKAHRQLMAAIRPIQNQILDCFSADEAGAMIVYLERITEAMGGRIHRETHGVVASGKDVEK